MTTTYSTDAQVQLRSSFGSVALAAINKARVDRSESSTTMDAYRVEAQRLLLIDLRARDITAADITRPDDLIESERCLTLALLCEAATQKGQSAQQTAVDLFGQEAARWRERYVAALAAASPVDGVRGAGNSFPWGRG